MEVKTDQWCHFCLNPKGILRCWDNSKLPSFPEGGRHNAFITFGFVLLGLRLFTGPLHTLPPPIWGNINQMWKEFVCTAIPFPYAACGALFIGLNSCSVCAMAEGWPAPWWRKHGSLGLSMASSYWQLSILGVRMSLSYLLTVNIWQLHHFQIILGKFYFGAGIFQPCFVFIRSSSLN